jgi:centromere/kinetochore protein ZW10
LTVQSLSLKCTPYSYTTPRALTALQTKIHGRIHEDLPVFEQQLTSSKAVQERFTALTANVDLLCDAVSNPEVARYPKHSFA